MAEASKVLVTGATGNNGSRLVPALCSAGVEVRAFVRDEAKAQPLREVGADRIVNAVAAYEKYKRSLIVVDFGTATTFDCISAKGEYLGGAIVTGMSISLDALASRTAKLPRIDISVPPQKAIGGNTVDAIKSGLLFGYGAMVDGLIKKLSIEFTDSPEIIATGGMSELIAPYTNAIKIVDPMLTLKGLYILYERNK